MYKQAHWNVKGPSFYERHLLFDEVSAAVAEYVDLMAERIAPVGRRCGRHGKSGRGALGAARLSAHIEHG